MSEHVSIVRADQALRRALKRLAAIGCLTATALASVAGQQAPPASQQTPPAPAGQTLPGGASQVQETHGDWRVTCAQQNGQKVCALSQQLADQNSRQLVLGLELKATTTDRAEGTLVMPFGLAVDKPVTLQIDEGGPTLTQHFRTCVPVGCLVALTLDGGTVSALRRGSALNVKATAAEGGKEAAFKLSLSGFGSALDRTAALSK